MEETLHAFAHYVALATNAVAIIAIAWGSIEAVIGGCRVLVGRSTDAEKSAVWLRYARWLVAGLTFQLAADIVETAIAPSWDEIGRLAAIAAIRTFLTFFLDRDVEKHRERGEPA
jgi:uncharacterized membrane protein